MIAEIIEVDSIKDLGSTCLLGQLGQQGMKLLLAEVAPINWVTGVLRVVEFSRNQLSVGEAKPGRLPACFLQQMGRQSR